MKKVAIVVADMTNGRGTERAVTNLSMMLENNPEYSVSVLSVFSNADSKPYYQLPKNVQVLHLGFKNVSIPKKIQNYKKIYKKLKNFVEQNKIDFILGTGHQFNILISLLKGVKKIGCEHRIYSNCKTASRILRRIFYPNLDALVLLTKQDSNNYGFIPESKKVIIPNSVSFVSEEKSNLNNKRMIAVGSLTKEKGFDDLIKIAVTLKKALPEWKIDVFGEGPEKKQLQSLINVKNLNDFVKLKGKSNNIQSEYLNSDLYLMTSYHESFSMVVVEAQTCGVPVVAFDIGYAIKEMVKDGQNGFLIQNRNIEEFAQKVIELAKNKELLRSFSVSSVENSGNYSVESISHLWYDLFKELS